MTRESVSIAKKVKGKLPRLPFDDIKDRIVGHDYELSLVFIGSSLSKKMHETHMRKDGPANILSFPLSAHAGEIFIDLERAITECANYGKSYDAYIGFLFIHGLLHLKGMTHGSTMEREEKNICAEFGF